MTKPLDTVVLEAPLVSRRSESLSSGVPIKPDWPTGLKLLPEHFQQQDRYHEDLVRHALRMAVGHPWGIVEIVLDEAALGSGQVGVSRLSGIFPDGTPIVAGASARNPVAPRYVEQAMRGRESLDVFVALPLERPGRAMVDPREGGPAPPRYVQEAASVPNYNTGRGAVDVPWGRPNVQILFEGESLDAYTTLRIARLRQTEGGVRLDPRFIAPVLRVRASTALEGRLRAVEKSGQAALAALGKLQVSGGEMSGTDAVRLLLASTLGRSLALLRTVLASDVAHPREAYRILAELVGAAAAFTPSGRAKVPGFDPLDLESTFDVLEREALDVLEGFSAPHVRAIPLEHRDGGLWRASLREPGIFAKEFLLVLTGGDVAMRTQIPRVAKVASWEEIAELMSRHLPGVVLKPESRRPRGVALAAEAVCFRLDKQSPAWRGVEQHGSLAISIPTSLTGIQATLLAQEATLLGGG